MQTPQAPASVILVRPHFFTPNPATLLDNAFQRPMLEQADEVARRARSEVSSLTRALRSHGVEVSLFDDTSLLTPDSVFPNNWVTTHSDGTVCLYPMFAPNRRQERRSDVLEHLLENFQVRRIIDYSPAEREGRFLEGTGAMVLDHVNRRAYACRSLRMDPALLEEFCRDRDYTPILFDASDSNGVPVYHTNVLMAVGTHLAIVGAPLIRDSRQRARVVGELEASGRDVLTISERQVRAFAGNCIELTGTHGAILAMSRTARSSLTASQVSLIERHCEIVAVDVPTIEAAGGSVRCMIAGNHLERRAPGSPSHTTTR